MKTYVFSLIFGKQFIVTFEDKDSNERIVFEISNINENAESLSSFINNNVNGLIGYNCMKVDTKILKLISANKSVSLNDINMYYFEMIEAIEKNKDLSAYQQLDIPILDLYLMHNLGKKERSTSIEWIAFQLNCKDLKDNCTTVKKLYTQSRNMIELRKKLSAKSGYNCINNSNTRIGSDIILSKYCKRLNLRRDEINRLRTNVSNIKGSDVIKIDVEFYSKEFKLLKNALTEKTFDLESDKDIIINYNGIELKYGISGLHGSVHDKIVKSDNEYYIIEVDVVSNHANIATNYSLRPQHTTEMFNKVLKEDILDVRIAEKNKPNSNIEIIDTYKEALVSAFGSGKNRYSWMYDPSYYMGIVLNAQLVLTKLIESLVIKNQCQILKVNTDSVMFKVEISKFETMDTLTEWMNTFNLDLKIRIVEKSLIKDVNSHITKFTDGNIETKGIFKVDKELYENSSASIIPIAIREYFINETPMYTTIKECCDIHKFTIGNKAKGTTKGKPWHELHSYKDGTIEKLRYDGVIRYIITKNGGVLLRCYKGGKEELLEKKNNKTFYSKIMNVIDDSIPISEYRIDYSYYTMSADMIIKDFEINKIKLF